jgi:uncharacterized protein YihD (DUF1040 family)
MTMFKQLLVLPLLALLLLPGMPQAQQTFPSISTTNVSDETLSLPDDLKGKKSILFLALTPQAEAMLEDWYEPVYTLFLDKSGINAMVYDCHVKLIMFFTGMGQAAADQVIDNIRSNMDDDFKDYLLFHQGSIKAEMDALGIKKKNDAYVFVLDETGKVIFSENGAYSEKKIDQIAELVEL